MNEPCTRCSHKHIFYPHNLLSCEVVEANVIISLSQIRDLRLGELPKGLLLPSAPGGQAFSRDLIPAAPSVWHSLAATYWRPTLTAEAMEVLRSQTSELLRLFLRLVRAELVCVDWCRKSWVAPSQPSFSARGCFQATHPLLWLVLPHQEALYLEGPSQPLCPFGGAEGGTLISCLELDSTSH